MIKRPVVELSDCVRCEVCTDVCPQVFRFNEAGYVEIVELAEYPEEVVDEAIRNCPSDCIAWERSNE